MEDYSDILGPAPFTQEELRNRDPFEPWTSEDHARLPKTKWLIGNEKQPILMANALWTTFGLYKSGKTFMAIDQAVCIAGGTPFNGHPTEAAPVAYVCAEGATDMILNRFKTSCRRHGVDSDQLLGPEGNLKVITAPVNLTDDDVNGALGVKRLIKKLLEFHPGYACVVIDTWARMLAAAGGNDTDAMTVMPSVAGCDLIRSSLGCTVNIVAHVGVSEKARDRPKGLSDLTGAVDGATKCEKSGLGTAAVFSFRALHQRFAAEGYTFGARIRAEDDDDQDGAYLEYISKRQAVATATKSLALDVLRELTETRVAVTVEEWRGETVARGYFTRGGKLARNQRSGFARDLEKLKERGLIRISGDTVMLAEED